MQYTSWPSEFQFLADIYPLLMGDDCHSGLELNCNAGIMGLIHICTGATLTGASVNGNGALRKSQEGVDSNLQERFHFIEAMF